METNHKKGSHVTFTVDPRTGDRVTDTHRAHGIKGDKGIRVRDRQVSLATKMHLASRRDPTHTR